MSLVIYLYVSMLCFLTVSAYKAWRFARMPLHGRMELYPVPQEKGHEYGGSYYEEVEWWNKPRQISKMSELKDMLKEMLFIKKLFDNQRPLWWLSYALHLGIYLLAGWTVLLVAGAATELAGTPVGVKPDTALSLWPALIYYLTVICGTIGLILAVFGSGNLFLRRVFDQTLQRYTTPQEYVNVFLLFAVAATGIFVWGTDLSFNTARHTMEHILTFTPLQAGSVMVVHFILLGIMFIYIPFSKMSHYIGKYFTFHKVLWENEPNLIGSEIEHKVKLAAAYKAQNSWSAPHVRPVVTPTKEM